MKLKFALITILLAFLLPLSTFAQTATPDLVVHLLDYLAKDYAGAVQNGKVVSEFEYKEQVEFAETIFKTTKAVPSLSGNPEFLAGAEKLLKSIQDKGDADEVSALARQLQGRAIELAGIQVSPTTWPDLANGAKLYQTHCISCHGTTGLGDGPAGKGLDPAPANFHDPDLVAGSAPFKFYNTIRMGVPGTGMAAYSQFSDQEIWSLAFYLKSLGYEKSAAATVGSTSFTLKEIASLTDEEMMAKLGGVNEQNKQAVAALRTTQPTSNQDPLDLATQLLNESFSAAQAGQWEQANSLALRSYLEGIEPVEPKIKANLPGYVEKIEAGMGEYRAALGRKAAAEDLTAKHASVKGTITEIKSELGQSQMSAGVAFGAAFSIFLREGFEVILIIVVLVSILRGMNEPKAIRWVHGGWIAAVVVGILAWFASGLLVSMSGISRELMEGGIALFAVAVLLYVGFWLHRYSEMKKWHAYLKTKLQHGLGRGSYLALAVVAFMAVFREAFEVVLFLRAILIDLEPSSHSMVTAGVLSSSALLAVLAYFAVRQSRKLPLGTLFRVCSWTMVALAFILAGKGIHSLQEAGAVSITPLPARLSFDLIGLYPTYETLLAQLSILLILAWVFWKDSREPEPAT